MNKSKKLLMLLNRRTKQTNKVANNKRDMRIRDNTENITITEIENITTKIIDNKENIVKKINEITEDKMNNKEERDNTNSLIKTNKLNNSNKNRKMDLLQ